MGFSRAIRVGDRILVSGTAPIPPPGEPVASTAYRQTLRCGEIIQAALDEAGATLDAVVRTRVFIVDPSHAPEVGRAHAEMFGEAAPAATVVVVAGLLDPAWMVEIEAEALL
jgi:enamine deaminase RidA (YjgF/YER057c/UK114 family)